MVRAAGDRLALVAAAPPAAALLHALAGAMAELLTLLECRADEAAERAAIQAEPPLPTNGTAERDRQDKAQRVILAGLLTVAGWPKSQRGTLGRRESRTWQYGAHTITKPKPETPSTEVAKAYVATPHERTAMQAYLPTKRVKAQRPTVKVKAVKGVVQIEPDHPDLAVAHVLLA